MGCATAPPWRAPIGGGGPPPPAGGPPPKGPVGGAEPPPKGAVGGAAPGAPNGLDLGEERIDTGGGEATARPESEGDGGHGPVCGAGEAETLEGERERESDKCAHSWPPTSALGRDIACSVHPSCAPELGGLCARLAYPLHAPRGPKLLAERRPQPSWSKVMTLCCHLAYPLEWKAKVDSWEKEQGRWRERQAKLPERARSPHRRLSCSPTAARFQ